MRFSIQKLILGLILVPVLSLVHFLIQIFSK